MSLTALGVSLVFALTAFACYALIKGHVPAKSELIHKAMVINAQFMTEIEQHLKHHSVCDQFEKTGSTFEDSNVDGDVKILFKSLLIQTFNRLDITAEKIDDKPDNVYLLKFLHGRKSLPAFDRVLRNILGNLIGSRYFDAALTAELFEVELLKCIADSKQMNGRVKLIRSGPVIQMEVYPDNWLLSWGPRLYTMDVVPAYRVGEKLYEWRPIKGDELSDESTTWHKSFALEERRMLCEGTKI